jgi:hypothetical protein
MPYLPLRKVSERSTRTLATDWLESLSHALADTHTDRSRLCRETLTSLHYPEYVANWETAVADASLPHATRLALSSMDPRNVTLEPEYYGECDEEKFQRVKPLLDDRGGIVLGNNVSISDYANIYSHTHSIVEQRDVTNATTVIEDGVRITYHATVLAGVHVHEQGMVGAMAVATKDVRPYHVYVGIPAKSVRVKPNAPAATNVLRTSIDRGKSS